jgi:hypothetical protein
MIATRPRATWIAVLALAGLAACGADRGTASPSSTSPAVPTPPPATVAPTPPTIPPTVPPTPPPTPSTVPPAPPTTSGGGSMQAGAPQFETFDVSSSVPCQGGNATAHMSFSTLNVVEIEISVGGGNFATTAGYGPNESDVVASIPCRGSGESSVQLRGCTEDHECVNSARQPVQITG